MRSRGRQRGRGRDELRGGVSGGRVSTDGQDGHAGLEAQRRAIAAACRRRGWQLLEPVEEADFSADELRRPGVQEALRVLELADAKALVAWKLDSLSRLLLDLACLLASAQQQGWALAALDCTLKTTTPPGSRSRTCSPPSPPSSGA